MSANTRQVGGDHYKTAFEHWDLVERYGLGYIEGCATKYVTRADRRGRRKEDLEKALHYVDKLIELAGFGHRQPRGEVPDDVLNDYAEANDLDMLEVAVIGALARWKDVDDLWSARALLVKLTARGQGSSGE